MFRRHRYISYWPRFYKDTDFQRRNIKGDSKNSTFNCQKTNHAILMLRDTSFNISDC